MSKSSKAKEKPVAESDSAVVIVKLHRRVLDFIDRKKKRSEPWSPRRSRGDVINEIFWPLIEGEKN